MTKKKILIIEDDIEVLDALKSLLESVGYNVSTAKDGFQGLMKARNAKPDLVLPEKSCWHELSIRTVRGHKIRS